LGLTPAKIVRGFPVSLSPNVYQYQHTLDGSNQQESAISSLSSAIHRFFPHAQNIKMVISTLLKKSIGKVNSQKRPQRKPDKPKQAPIQFLDAVGRKFTFPYEMITTWSVSTKYSLVPHKI
jgi:hypothetical protein